MDILKQGILQETTLEDEFTVLVTTLERYGITTVDLLTASLLADGISRLARKIGRSLTEVSEFTNRLKLVAASSIIEDLVFEHNAPTLHVCTGIDSLDQRLNGGAKVGDITEVFGASGTGKSQLLLQMSMNSVKLHEASKSVYISTESAIATSRLKEMAGSIAASHIMENIMSIYCSDLEHQDHILYTQLPVLLDREKNINLVVIDSISHHLRRDDHISITSYLETRIREQEAKLSKYDCGPELKRKHDYQLGRFFRFSPRYKTSLLRATYISLLHYHLLQLARKYSIAIVVANQVSDQPDFIPQMDFTTDKSCLDLDYQVGFFAGWDNNVVASYQENEEPRDLPANYNVTKHGYMNSKRQKVNDGLFTSPQGQNYTITHSGRLVMTKRVVPALGYQWIKSIQVRILLIKTYKEAKIKTNETDSSEFSTDETNTAANDIKSARDDSNFHESANTLLASTNKSWLIERFAKVVSNHCSFTTKAINEREKIEIRLDETGLHEVRR